MSLRTSLTVLSLAVVLVQTLPHHVSAEVGSLEAAGEWVAVWQTEALIKEGQDLANVGQYDLAAQRMVCIVEAGTRTTATFAGGVRTLDNTGYIGGFARVVVLDGPAKGCTGYVESMYVRDARAPSKARSAPSPCWMTKDEMTPIKAAVDAGNLAAAGELNQRAAERMAECKKSPCFMTKEEGASIKAAYAAGNYKLGKELQDRSTERSNKCWGR